MLCFLVGLVTVLLIPIVFYITTLGLGCIITKIEENKWWRDREANFCAGLVMLAILVTIAAFSLLAYIAGCGILHYLHWR